VPVQQRRAIAAEKAIKLRDRHQSFKEKEQRLKEMKYEGKILKMNTAKLCLEIMLNMVHFKKKLGADTVRVNPSLITQLL